MNGNNINKTLGLCLAGGGGLALLHIGLFEAMDELNLRPGVVGGTSSGAVMAAFYATGKSVDEIKQILDKFNWPRIFAPAFHVRGFMSTSRLENFFRKAIGDVDISDLPIKLKIAAIDLHSGRLTCFTSGPLARCLAASCAVPGIFEPVQCDQRTYYDAGGIYNLPLEIMCGENLRMIIAGNTIGESSLMSNPKTIQDVFYQAYLIRTRIITKWRVDNKNWEGRQSEDLVFIDYPSEGINPAKLDELRIKIDQVRKISLEALRPHLKALSPAFEGC